MVILETGEATGEERTVAAPAAATGEAATEADPGEETRAAAPGDAEGAEGDAEGAEGDAGAAATADHDCEGGAEEQKEMLDRQRLQTMILHGDG